MLRLSCTLGAVVALLLVAIDGASAQSTCVVDIGDEQSTQCAHAQFCTAVRFVGIDSATGEPTVDRQCRQCDVASGGAQLSQGVYDALNVCNCPAGSYCRQTAPSAADQPALVGQCASSALRGQNCSVDEDCEGVRETSLDGGFSRRERLYCVAGRCAQCSPALFAAAYGSSSTTCRGYVQQPDGTRLYLSTRPGVAMTCNADGSLSESGAVNLELRDSVAASSTTTTGSSSNTTPSPRPIKIEKEEEPSYVPALLALGFALQVFILTLLIGVCVTVTLCFIKLRRQLRSSHAASLADPPLRSQ